MTDSSGIVLGKAFETTVFYSYCDPNARKAMERIVRDTVNHFQQDPRGRYIVGWNFKYMTNSDWLYPAASGFYDYSTPALAAYRKFLQQKYGSITALNQAYDSAFSSFESVEMPQPPFGRIDCSPRWREFQEFRRMQPAAAIERIRRTIRELDPHRRIISWYTTAIWAAARDTVVLDDAIEIARNNPGLLTSLTCFDYLNPAGEIWGQLALNSKTPVNVEPVFNTAQSYLRTFYNCLRFPVAQVNWLYVMPRHDPRERPWVVWVLNRGALLDEAAQAELVRSPVTALLSYSDQLLQVTPELRGNLIEPMREFLHASETAGLQLAWITDYTDSVDWETFRTIVIPGATMLCPEAIEKLRKFVFSGGKLVLKGKCAGIDLESGRETWPLYRALGRPASSEDEQQEWSFGKGRIIQLPSSCSNGEVFRKLDIVPPVEVTPKGPGAFLKRSQDAWYVGIINAKGSRYRGRVVLPSLPAGEYRAADLVNGTRVEMNGNSFELSFDFPDELRFIKIVPAASMIRLPERAAPEALHFQSAAKLQEPRIPLASEEGGECWIPAGTAARPVVTALYPDEEEGERYFRIEYPARNTPEAGAAYVTFPLEHLLAMKTQHLVFRLRSSRAGSIDLVLPECNWKSVLSHRVEFTGAPGEWQEFSLNLGRDFSGEIPLKELRGELFLYSRRGENAAPAVAFELSDVRFEEK
ncbi:alpha-amylase family protein [Victivallis vadensis]|uniref:alpha-amylase family protein n=1 Tax=Victivallis vadensis TaxID=172901 RepID=UPI0023F43910|nr:alpha-amylase family protein [Victivallis vadensis]